MSGSPQLDRPVTLKIIYQDEHYVAIDKPSGLLVHRSPLAKNESVFALQLLRDHCGCKRLMLRALSLRFTHRVMGERVCLHAGSEEAFDEIMERLDLKMKKNHLELRFTVAQASRLCCVTKPPA